MLVSVLMLLAVVTVVSTTSITTMLMDLRMSGYYSRRVLVFYIAQAGVNRGRYELSNSDGHQDFSSIIGPTTVFQSEALNGGSYQVIAIPVAGAVPAKISLQSTGCYPAADPCPLSHARSVVETLLEWAPEETIPEKQVRAIAWREVY